jgi:S1-C subfamily serine protease
MIPATADVGHLVDGLRPSLVGISTGDPGRPLATGVAMAHGVIVTTVAAVSGAAHLDVVTASGQREPAQILGTDSGSGVAVLQIADELPPAAFADDDADTDELAVAACLCGSLPPAGTVPVSQALTAVRATGVEPVLAGVQLLDAVEAGVPAALGPSPVGAPLVDGRGRVLGILAGSLGDGSTGVFVSAPLVAGVADQLAATRQVSHGWLGVAGTDTPDACGVTVTAVQPGSPAAAAGLHAGEVVSGVDGHRVCSLGELRARLYVLAPGTPTEIDIAVPSGTAPVTAVLTGAPG